MTIIPLFRTILDGQCFSAHHMMNRYFWRCKQWAKKPAHPTWLFFNIQYHFVFVTKFRYKVLKGDVGLKVHLIRQTREAFEIEILKGVVSQDLCIFGFCANQSGTERTLRRVKGAF
jgi:Transposase IS200 like